LLGKVFENLLASYNEDTKTTARKSTGSFYTPREIVAYMVDETLLAYLQEQVPDVGEEKLRTLLKPADIESDLQLSDLQKEALIRAIENVRVLDPACGSGAFPMGMLQRLVSLLAKLDPKNITFKQQRLIKAERDLQRAREMEDEEIRKKAVEDAEDRIKDIKHSFDDRYHELDFARKLYLIEDCIYGVDIQPIAVQIAKLRFFITLIVDQKTDRKAPNQGVRPLPNLETKLVAANSLLPLAHSAQLGFGDYTVERLREELRQVRHDYFQAKDPTRKAECRANDEQLRKQISGALQSAGWPPTSAEKLAAWNPYDPNTYADFFEPKWMFGGQTRSFRPAHNTVLGSFSFVNEVNGQMELSTASQSSEADWLFDIVLGNPPYVRQEQIKELKPLLKPVYECYTGTADLYVYFYERGINLLRPGGAFAFITSNKWMRSSYGEGLRNWLSKNTTLSKLIDFGDEPIFTAIAYPCIVILTKNKLPKNYQQSSNEITVLNWQSSWDTANFLEVLGRESFRLPQKELTTGSWQITGQNERSLLEEIKYQNILFGEYVNNRFYRGITTGLNEAFVLDQVVHDEILRENPLSEKILKPYLRGRDIKRWTYDFADLWLLFIPWHFPLHEDNSIRGASMKAEFALSEQYPAIYQHLSKYKNALENRNKSETGIRYEWYALQRWGADYWSEFERPKIIFPDIARKPEFTYDTNNHFLGNTMYLIPTGEKWLLSVLNSPVIHWYYKRISSQIQNGFLRFISQTVSKIPVPHAAEEQRRNITKIVDCILTLSNFGKREQIYISAFENLLNGLVYALYFPKELGTANIPIFEIISKSNLPNISSIPKDEQLSVIYELHEKLFQYDHPIRSALFSLRGIDFVRIIEEETNIVIEVAPDETKED